MFISKLQTDARGARFYYVAVRSTRGQKYLWRRVPRLAGPEHRIPADAVPEAIRERAYDMTERDRLREVT